MSKSQRMTIRTCFLSLNGLGFWIAGTTLPPVLAIATGAKETAAR